MKYLEDVWTNPIFTVELIATAMNFKSLIELQDYFKDEKTCITYYEQIRWNGSPVCPHCGSTEHYTLTKKVGNEKVRIGYKCANNKCYKKFNVKTGTIFDNTKIELRVWFQSIFLATTAKKGISSLQLATQIGVTQKTAWFVLHRVREMLKVEAPTMLGGEGAMVEADETYIGGKTKNKHANKIIRDGEGRAIETKQTVLGLIERDGKVVLKHIKSANVPNMVPFVEKTVQLGTRIFTDEARVYDRLGKNYTHNRVNHTLKVYVQGDIHTNTIENFWSVLKRGIYGIYHSVSEKHLERYLHEFSQRFNERHLTSQARFEKFLVRSDKRLKYEDLIA